ncbi:MAG TPA: DUF3800 domain-containing protein [Gemmatimonadaceae bacterium]|nr:DUF3800 domain-containing protein [Gemmatimonadaceae bacterium]
MDLRSAVPWGAKPFSTANPRAVSRHAFVDAYGDPGLQVELEATTTAFIVAAVVVDHEDLASVRSEADAIRSHFFGPGPIKSKKVADDDERRLEILSRLMALPLKFAAVALDKARTPQDGDLLYPGLRFPPSFFYKFTHSKLFEPLYSRHEQLTILADRIGREEYMDSFRDYVQKRQQDLFVRHSFDFAPSREDVLIQVADFVAGSLARLYDPKKLSPRAREIQAMLMPRAWFVIDWPKRFRLQQPLELARSVHDDRVRHKCLERVWSYVEEHEDSGDADVTLRVEALRCLLFWFEAEGEDAWLVTEKLTELLGHKSAEPISEHKVRSVVIAPLRDQGVLIASSTQGYKIPSCVDDIRSYLEHTQKVVAPMLRRARAARESVLELTDGETDVLDDPHSAVLLDALDGRLLFPEPRTRERAS